MAGRFLRLGQGGCGARRAKRRRPPLPRLPRARRLRQTARTSIFDVRAGRPRRGAVECIRRRPHTPVGSRRRCSSRAPADRSPRSGSTRGARSRPSSGPCSPARIASPRPRSRRRIGRSADAAGSAYYPPRPPLSTSTTTTPNAGIWRASPRNSREQCGSTSSAAARTGSRHSKLRLARERLGDPVESTELPGGHLAAAEQTSRLADRIEALDP